MSKRCSKCNIIKNISCFYKDVTKNDKLGSNCKDCVKKSRRDKYSLNKEKMINKSMVYYNNNKEEVKKRKRKYYLKNREDILNNRKRYYVVNKTSIRERHATYQRERRSKDPIFKLKHNISSLIRISIGSKGFRKKTKTMSILGCDYEELMKHLNSNPYGLLFGDKGVDLDHIIPISSASTEEEVLFLNHYSNLQLLPSYYNRYIKKDEKFNRCHFEEWFNKNYK